MAAFDQPLAAGTIVGAYRLLELLGEGGMGRVYLAEHVKLGRRVAVKLLRPELAANPIAVSRFFAEARAVNRISHENIVEITDFLENQGGHNCYIMELLRGEDLGRRLLRETFLPLPAIVEIGAQISSGLAAVHAAGIVHRDLKPDNIFLSERPGRPYFVKLLDFGVAKLTDPSGKGISMHTTGAGQIIGTPEYMSPEQAGGQEVDHRTDIYALGVILYELVTGTLPFRAKSFGELVIKHMTVPPKRPASYLGLPHAVSEDLDALIMEMLAKDVADRPHSMSDVEHRLHDMLDAMDLPPQPRSWRVSGVVRVPAASGEMPVVKPPELPKADAESSRRMPITPPAVGVQSAGTAKTIDSSVSPASVVELAGTPEPPRVLVRWPFIAGGIAALALALVAGVFLGRAGREPEARPATAAVTPPPPPPAPAPVDAPGTVKIRFASTPPGASVRIEGDSKLLGVTPFTATLPRGETPASVTIDKAGFVALTQQVALDTDTAITVALSAAPPPVAAPAKPVEHKPTATKRPAPQRPVDRSGTMDVFGGH